MYSKMPTKPKICIFFRFGLPATIHDEMKGLQQIDLGFLFELFMSMKLGLTILHAKLQHDHCYKTHPFNPLHNFNKLNRLGLVTQIINQMSIAKHI